uniref:Translation initiation factor beta propellor-like domain-containing protein n=1 Tax=Trichuris muris TaxID=70415 RepID=A0A5S6Q1N7_TRIMR
MEPIIFTASECERLLFWYLLHCGTHAEVCTLLSESNQTHDMSVHCSFGLILPVLLEAGRKWQNKLLSAAIGRDVNVPFSERPVQDLVGSDVGKEEASSDNGNSVCSMEVEPLYLLSCDERMVCQVRWDSEGQFIAAGCMDEGGRLWHLEDRQFTEWPLSPDCFVPDGSWKVLNDLENHRPQYVSLCWSNKGSKVAVGIPSGFVIVQNEDGRLCGSHGFHKGIILDVIFSPNDVYVLSVGEDSTCIVWNVVETQPLQRYTGHQEAVSCCIWKDNESFFTGGADGLIMLWHIDKPKPVQRLVEHSACVNCIAISGDGKLLASGSDDCTSHQESVLAIAWNPVSADSGDVLLASCSADSTVCLYDVINNKCSKCFAEHESQVCAIDFSHDGKLLASGDFRGMLYVWDVQTMAIVMTYDANSMDGGTITSVRWDNNSSRLAVGTERGKIAILPASYCPLEGNDLPGFL